MPESGHPSRPPDRAAGNHRHRLASRALVYLALVLACVAMTAWVQWWTVDNHLASTYDAYLEQRLPLLPHSLQAHLRDAVGIVQSHCRGSLAPGGHSIQESLDTSPSFVRAVLLRPYTGEVKLWLRPGEERAGSWFEDARALLDVEPRAELSVWNRDQGLATLDATMAGGCVMVLIDLNEFLHEIFTHHLLMVPVHVEIDEVTDGRTRPVARWGEAQLGMTTMLVERLEPWPLLIRIGRTPPSPPALWLGVHLGAAALIILLVSGVVGWLRFRVLKLNANLRAQNSQLFATSQNLSSEVAYRVQTKLDLRECESRYRALVETQTELMCIWRPDTTLVFVNEAYARCFGKEPGELVGRSFFELIPEEQQASVREFLARSVDSPQAMTYEHQVVDAQGQRRWHIWRDTPILNERGEAVEFLSTGVDISDRKAAEQALQAKSAELDRFFSTSLDLFCIADMRGYFVMLNPVWENVLGYTLDELMSRPFVEFVHPDDIESTINVVYKLESGQVIDSFENRYLHKDGSYRWIEWRSRCIDGMLYAAARDVTQRREWEEGLRHARQVAEEASRAKSEFLATISHEIRTPMNAIIGMTSLLMDQPMNRRLREGVSTIRRAADDLLLLLNDVLDFSRMEAGKLRIEAMTMRLVDVNDTVINLFKSAADAKGLSISASADPYVSASWLLGDPNRLRQVLMNLVGNAIKFTHQGGIEIRTSLEREEAGLLHVFIDVIDTGMGIEPTEMPKLFQAFYQFEHSRRLGGTGLGLTISRQLVESMGGSIEVQSVLGKGSRFRIRLPFPKVDSPARSNPHNTPSTPDFEGLALPETLRSLRVLVVEDHPMSREITAEMLARMGHLCTTVGDGNEALDVLRQQPFDVVLIDLRLPELDGIEASRRWRAIERETHRQPVHVVAMTAEMEWKEREGCEAAGMNDFLPKPFDFEALARAIEKVRISRDLDSPQDFLPMYPTNSGKDISDTFGREELEPAVAAATATMPAPSGGSCVSTLLMFDCHVLDQATAGNREIQQRLIDIFIKDSHMLIESMEQQAENQDFEGLCNASHRLKGGAAVVGSPAISQLAAELEGMARRATADPPALQACIRTLASSLLEFERITRR